MNMYAWYKICKCKIECHRIISLFINHLCNNFLTYIKKVLNGFIDIIFNDWISFGYNYQFIPCTIMNYWDDIIGRGTSVSQGLDFNSEYVSPD